MQTSNYKVSEAPPASLPSLAPNDRFSRLPAELLREIFHLAYPEDREQPSSPLSRSLLPFYLEVVYQDVKTQEYEKLDKLCKLLTASPERAELIKKLRIFIEYSQSPKREGKVTRSPSNTMLIGVFKLLDNLRTLQVFGSSRIAQLAVSSQVAGGCFPFLEELLLNSTFRDLDDPFHLSVWTNLVFYRNLKAFELVVTNRIPHSIKPPAKPSVCPGIIFPHCFFVSLDGPLATSPGAHGLVESLNAPAILHLRDFDSQTSIVPLLEHVDPPECIFCLRIDSWQVNYDPAVLDALVRFRELDELELAEFDLVSSGPALYDTLLKLEKLRHLVMGAGVDVSTAGLESLISGPNKHKSLKHITLDNVGGDLDDDDYEPGWTEAFEPDGLEDLLGAAKEADIKVDGTAVGALDLYREMEHECDCPDCW
ncbi:hypothetical protein JCM8547_004855 [Rhodosporidiobolus lusitaniae]